MKTNLTNYCSPALSGHIYPLKSLAGPMAAVMAVVLTVGGQDYEVELKGAAWYGNADDLSSQGCLVNQRAIPLSIQPRCSR